MPDALPVAVELLDFVDDYINESEINAALEAELDADSNLIVFSRELFAQLFANVIAEPLTGFAGVNAQRANVLRRTAAGRRWGTPLRRLVSHFQRFCKIYSDVLSEGYSTSEARSDFHFEFIPSVLNDLKAWAEGEGYVALVARISNAQQSYHAYLALWDPEQ